MNANLLIKSILHVVAGVMTLSFAALSFDHNMPLAIGLLPDTLLMFFSAALMFQTLRLNEC